MRERVELLVGRATRAMWVMTFHSACARMLRADAAPARLHAPVHDLRLGRPAPPDQEVPRRPRDRPQALHARARCRSRSPTRRTSCAPPTTTASSSAPSSSRRSPTSTTPTSASCTAPTRWTSTTCSFRAVNLLELFQEVRDRYANAFRWILVDEYQDTNHAQYRWLQLLSSEHRNLAVVGDDDQCLVEGTLVTMADGSERPIELVDVGEEVLSCYGSGDLRPARVTDVFRSERSVGVAITTRSGPTDRQHARARRTSPAIGRATARSST